MSNRSAPRKFRLHLSPFDPSPHRCGAPGRPSRAILLVAVGALISTATGCGGSSQHARATGTGPGGAGASSGHRAGARRSPARSYGWTSRQLAAVDRVLGYTPYISLGSGRRRDVALTFDDGPSSFTPQILAILRRERAPATFFQIGRAVQAYPAIARQVLSSGLPIGDHTQTHPLLGHLSTSTQRNEVLGAARAIRSAGAPFPRLFRPPYGSFDPATLAVLRSRHMLMILWTVDTKDFSQPGEPKIKYLALSGARPGAIILMHDGGGPRAQTVAALPRIIHVLRRRHFRLVTVPQLILDDPPPRHQAAPHSLAGR